MLQHETNNKCVKKKVFCEYSVSGQTALEEVKRVCNGLGWVGGHGWGTWGWGIQGQRVKRLGGDEGLGGWLVMPPIKGRGNLLPRVIIGGLGNLNISSLSHLSSFPVLKKWIREIYWKGRRIYFCPSAKVSSITHSIVNRESAVSIKTHFKKNCIWSYYSSNTFPTYFNTFCYISKLRKTALYLQFIESLFYCSRLCLVQSMVDITKHPQILPKVTNVRIFHWLTAMLRKSGDCQYISITIQGKTHACPRNSQTKQMI